MSYWNYRVMEFTSNGETWRAIHEVHYSDKGELKSYSEDAASVLGEPHVEGERGGLGWTLDRMNEALLKPILTNDDFVLKYSHGPG